MTRTQARKNIFYLIFEQCFHKEDMGEIISAAVEARELEADDYVNRIARGVSEHREELDQIISPNLVGWRLDRLPKVSLCLMRLAVYEMRFCSDTPVGVAINEAVELAKEFGGDDEPAYINGALGSIARKTEEPGS